MGWMDNLTRKVSQAESVTGRRISGPAIESAVAGGLASDYEMAFKNAAAERGIRARQKEIDQQNAQFNATLALDREKVAQQGAQFGQTLAQNQDKINKEYALGLARNDLYGQQGDAYERAMDKQSVAALTKTGLTQLPTIEKYVGKAAGAIGDLFPGSPNPVGTPDPYETATAVGGMSAVAGAEIGGGAAEFAAMHGLAGQGASEAITAGFGGSLDFATSASEAVGYWVSQGAATTAGVVGGIETMAAETIANFATQAAFSGAMEAVGMQATAVGVSSMVAETGLVSSIMSGIQTVSTFCPYIGLAMLGMSFFAPSVVGEAIEGVTDVAEGAWDVVSDVGEQIGDFVGDIGDTIGGFIDDIGDSSIICTELYRQGRLDKRDLVSTNQYRLTIDPDIYQGYLTLFAPVVRLMQRNKYFNYFAAWLFKGFAQEMVHRMRPQKKASIRGKILIGFFSPICKTITMIKEKKYECFGHRWWGSSRV